MTKRKRVAIASLALYTVLLGAFAAGPVAAEALGPGSCPDAFAIPASCSADMKGTCQAWANENYEPGCTVLCATCEGNAINCKTSPAQCVE